VAGLHCKVVISWFFSKHFANDVGPTLASALAGASPGPTRPVWLRPKGALRYPYVGKAVVVLAKLREIFNDEETHFVTLTEHFFSRFFNNEFVSQADESQWTVIHILALLPLAPIFYSLFAHASYAYIYWHFSQAVYDRATMVDQFRFVVFSMIIIGFVAVLEWDALFPGGRDYAVLMPLPLKSGVVFAAKGTAVALLLSVFTADLTIPAALLYPTAAVSGSPKLFVSMPYGLRMVAAHLVSVGAASVFIFLLFVALQGVLICSLRYRIFKRVSLYVQVISLVALLLMFPLMSLAPSLLPLWMSTNSRALFLAPPMWFLGLYRTLLGSNEEAFRHLALISVYGLAAVALVSAATYLISYKFYIQKASEVTDRGDRELGWVRCTLMNLVNRFVVRKPLERATFYFVAATILRSARHRLYLATYLGVGIALTLLGLGEIFVRSHHGAFLASLRRPDEALLSVPLILSFFVLSGMRMVFAIPAELAANWAFQIAEQNDHKDCLSGVRKTMTLLGVVPLFGLLFPLYALLWGLGAALFETAFGVTLAVALVELLLLNFRKVPFTCSHAPAKANFVVVAVGYWFALTIYGYTMAQLEYWMMQDPARWITGLALAVGAVVWMVAYRDRVLARGFEFLYEEEPDPAVQVLGLN
jgi:hypothetical protein